MSRKPVGDETPLPPHGKPPPVADSLGAMPCRWCGMLTQRAMLNHYGARCLSCYEAYCREPLQAPKFIGNKLDPLSWAHALRDREQSGERLSIAQRTMWREALGLPITGAISTWEQTPEEYAAGQPGRHA